MRLMIFCSQSKTAFLYSIYSFSSKLMFDKISYVSCDFLQSNPKQILASKIFNYGDGKKAGWKKICTMETILNITVRSNNCARSVVKISSSVLYVKQLKVLATSITVHHLSYCHSCKNDTKRKWFFNVAI